MAADWQAIKTEYITTNTSYRKLAEKYGVTHVAIANVGGKEGWVKLREQHLTDTLAKTTKAVSSAQAQRATKIAGVADKLIAKIEAYIDGMEMSTMDAKSIRAISGAIKDLQDIHFIRSEHDIREQEARIAKLQKEAAPEKTENDGVSLQMDIPEDYIG